MLNFLKNMILVSTFAVLFLSSFYFYVHLVVISFILATFMDPRFTLLFSSINFSVPNNTAELFAICYAMKYIINQNGPFINSKPCWHCR